MGEKEDLENKLKADKQSKLASIKTEPNRFKRFWKYVWFWLTFTWKWVWSELKDWRTFIIFILVMLVIGVEVWLPLILGLMFDNSYLVGVAMTCEAFWLLPGTPFVPLCIVITIAIKKLIRRIRRGKTNKM